LSEKDELGYPLWMKLPMSFWLTEELTEFLEECCEESKDPVGGKQDV